MIATENKRVFVFGIDVDWVKIGSAAYGSGGKGDALSRYFGSGLALKQATSSRLFGVKNRAAANGNERVAGVTMS